MAYSVGELLDGVVLLGSIKARGPASRAHIMPTAVAQYLEQLRRMMRAALSSAGSAFVAGLLSRQVRERWAERVSQLPLERSPHLTCATAFTMLTRLGAYLGSWETWEA